MAAPQIIRWGAGLSVVAVALAVALRMQQQPLGGLSPSSQTQTFCYQGIRTHDETRQSANCLAVSSGIFTDVFTREDSGSLDVASGYVIPGLWGGHGHLLQYGEFLQSVDLFGSASVDEVKTRVSSYINEHPGAGTNHEWLRGVGWDQMAFGRMPTAVSPRKKPSPHGL